MNTTTTTTTSASATVAATQLTTFIRTAATRRGLFPRPVAAQTHPLHLPLRAFPAPCDRFTPEGKLKPLVMIADDDENVRTMLRFYMERHGFRVREVGRGMQVLAHLHHNPDVVLLDLTMPGLDGEDCLTELRKRRPDTKVIVISGRITEKTKMDHLDAFECFPKPFDHGKLIDTVKRAVELKKQQQSAASSQTTAESTSLQ